MMKNKRIAKLAAILTASIFLLNANMTGYAQKLNASYVYFGNKNNYVSYVNNTQNSLNTVYPSYFDLNEDGSLKLTTLIDKNFINEMHKKNIKVVPFLSNHWDRNKGRAALANKVELVKSIKNVIDQYNLDGINVDIENVTDVDKNDYTEFVKLLRESISSDKEISVAVAANPNGWNVGWQGSYDYEKLSKYSDYLFIMTYDESYQGSAPGPVASISFVERSIQYALKYVSSDKIVLGIPFFGRYWKEGSATGGYGVSLNKINEIIKNNNGKVVFDSKSKAPMATVNAPDGTYIYWYENDESIKEKLKLVQKYNLKGSGSWSLGQELPSIWKSYNLWQNGHYFIDTNNHWAENSILSMDNKGWMKGVSSSYFAPDKYLTRAQAAVILVRALDLQEDINEFSFNDVKSNYWASKEIEIAKNHGILQGKGENIFSPEDIITREEMATILDRLLNKQDENMNISNVFTDVTEDSWAYNSIMKMNGNGIFKGYENNKFYPKGQLTRAQMATLMDRINNDIENIKNNK